MTFDEWLSEAFKDYKDLPSFGQQLHIIQSGNLRKAWDASRIEERKGWIRILKASIPTKENSLVKKVIDDIVKAMERCES